MNQTSDKKKECNKFNKPDKTHQFIKRTNSFKVAYLTFDDGPSKATKKILDTLAQYDAVGTFFMLEPNIRRFPALVRRIVDEGHGIGLHGVTHIKEKFYASKQSVIDEFNQTRTTLQKTSGIITDLVRTPYGSRPNLRKSFAKAIRDSGYQLWDWNVDSKDWKYRSEQSVRLVMKQVKQLEKSKVSPVILMHDLKETAGFLPQILTYLKERGYTLKKLNSSLKPVQFVK